MRLCEMRSDRRPKEAGKAIIKYSDSVGHPTRKGKVITLPKDGSLELFKLQPDWNQFLVHQGDSIWFGGTDENPFLVRMDYSILNAYLKSPNDFYPSIVPTLMGKVKERFPQMSYRRQGDIFAFPLPYTWEDLEKAFEICYWNSFTFHHEPTHINNTRHILTGKYLNLKREYSLFGQLVNLVVEGVVKAPDHTPMKLEGPHAIGQTAFLYNPPEAD